MNLKKILESNISEKESKVSALFCYSPPVEERINDELYSGLAEVALSTSFDDYYKIYKDLNGDLIDYGAGYCKGSLLFESLGDKKCFSYELKQSRLEYTKALMQKMALNSQSIIKRDLLTEDIPIGENYLIYLPLGDVFFRLVHQLYSSKKEAIFYIIESHGDFLEYIENLPLWLKKIDVIDSESLRHKNGIHKYRFNPVKFNEHNLLYHYIASYNQDLKIDLIEENKRYSINLKKTLPLKYNNKMCLEAFELKRIVDGNIIRFADSHLKIGE